MTSETGRVFDVRRFSTHDGGGIRTTVFLKGCPLTCAWCHNPEGIAFARRPLWLAGRCVGCGACLAAAQHGGVVRGEDGLRLRPEAGEDWDALIDKCPSGALRWDSRDVTVDQLMEELRRDKPFYAHGGGVTLSGGDPLSQPAFAAAVLRRCRAEGIHTAVETELYAGRETLRGVLKHADLIYADCKLIDAKAHERYTGVANGLILDNLRMLLKGDLHGRVIVRTPLIPGITDTGENIALIARFLSGLNPDVRWELLNYNPLAPAKYPLVNRQYPLGDLKKLTEPQMAALRALARENGIRNIIAE